MFEKTIAIIAISFLLGCCITAGAGYFFVLGPNRLALAASRAEADEYRSRTELGEARLAEGVRIIASGEAKLSAATGNIQQAIQQIREIRTIILSLKKVLQGSDNS